MRSAVVTPRPLPAVLVVPLPVQPAPQSTSTTASLLPPLPAASSPSAPDRLRVEHPPPETVHRALPLVADSDPPAAAFVAAFVAPGVPAFALWPASVLLLAEPVHVAAQSTSASATTSSVESSSPRSTVLEVPHPPAPSQCAVLLPCRLVWPVSASAA
ncbi:hypothetical protein GCM10023320_34400 [Pseudonocardia adelaidensis]|uniref:Secreted protein n=1 Tax=Pseudonocardia adelaidensis TaxID=648754 RepID=A0ABP9NJS1_9PSEU